MGAKWFALWSVNNLQSPRRMICFAKERECVYLRSSPSLSRASSYDSVDISFLSNKRKNKKRKYNKKMNLLWILWWCHYGKSQIYLFFKLYLFSKWLCPQAIVILYKGFINHGIIHTNFSSSLLNYNTLSARSSSKLIGIDFILQF